MRLVTRGDVDGLACAVFLKAVEQIDDIRFAHPKDMQDGLFEVTAEDVVANLPHHPDCGMWFDHHVTELVKVKAEAKIKGKWGKAPSAARLIYEYFDDERLKRYDDFLYEVDRYDSANLDSADVTDPQGWILIAYTIDPRSGLGRFRDYFKDMVEWVRTKPLEEILAIPEVKRRCDLVLEQQQALLEILKTHSRQEGDVIVTDFRSLEKRPVGNRFLVYTLFPDATVEARIFHGKYEVVTVVAVGKSIFNRTCPVDVGKMLAEYGGGGHPGAGTCQLTGGDTQDKIKEIIERLQGGR